MNKTTIQVAQLEVARMDGARVFEHQIITEDSETVTVLDFTPVSSDRALMTIAFTKTEPTND